MVHEVKAVHGTRARRRARTMATIVDTALRVLTEEGFEALTMKRLAQELGYATGAFYRYFASKDELLLAVQRRVLEALAADLRDAEAGAGAHIEGLEPEVAALIPLLAAARTYATLGTRRPAHFALLSRWLGRPEPLVSTEAAIGVIGSLVDLFEPIPRLFEQAAARGALQPGDGQRRAYVLWSSLQGALSVQKLDRFGLDAFSHHALVTELLRALFVGWGASSAGFAAAWARASEL